MARRSTPQSMPDLPQVSPEQGIELIEKQIAKASDLLGSGGLTSDNYGSWELLTRNILEKVFGSNSANVSSVIDVGKYGSFPMSAGESWWAQHRRKSLQTQITKLKGLVEFLQTEVQLKQGATIKAIIAPKGHKIFLVHGHDEKVLQETARFLEKLSQGVIVLREQPNQGRTIIEKFEDYADVGFAVILLTGDDRGGTADGPCKGQSPRARQNVIFEFGYFIGRLGRNRVCALYEPGVEIPSDYSGVIYIELDEKGVWRLGLAKEMKAAGLPVDMNLAF